MGCCFILFGWLYASYTVSRPSALRPGCARIVGALTSGHIIESGSNANGNYVRFADGTQVCYLSRTITQEENSGQGAVVTYPASFIRSNDLIVVATPRIATSMTTGGIGTVEIHGISITGCEVKVLILANGGTLSAAQTPCTVVAIGRWKA